MGETTLQREIEKTKERLIKKAKKSGIYENFGQKEVREMYDRFDYSTIISQFDEWVSNFDLIMLRTL